MYCRRRRRRRLYTAVSTVMYYNIPIAATAVLHSRFKSNNNNLIRWCSTAEIIEIPSFSAFVVRRFTSSDHAQTRKSTYSEYIVISAGLASVYHTSNLGEFEKNSAAECTRRAQSISAEV